MEVCHCAVVMDGMARMESPRERDERYATLERQTSFVFML
jgi:hypothetical protein